MDIWIIKNGEKVGPFPDYEIRSRISLGDLKRGDRVWHDGLGEWTRLENIEIFQNEFESGKVADEVVQPPKLPEEYVDRFNTTNPDSRQKKPKKHLARRFWARWMDLFIYSAIWWLSMYAVGRDIGAAIRNPWLQLSVYVPWFALEAWLIQRFGTTPGKWLMGIRVRNEDGSLLNFRQSVWRSLRVMITGIGFGWGLLTILCQGMSWFTTRRIGKPIWDFLGAHQVEAKPLNPFKVIALIGVMFIGAQLQMSVRGPYEQEIIVEKYPDMERFFESSERWYLPKRN
ncbi:MAG: RDD family protein [Akkermansiaceae bacterium]